MLVTKRFKIIICRMVEKNFEHKRVSVPFCIYVILFCIWKEEVSTFKSFPLSDVCRGSPKVSLCPIRVEVHQSFYDSIHLDVDCIRKRKGVWGGSSHAYTCFFPSCVSIPQGCGHLLRKEDKHALCQAAIRPVFSFFIVFGFWKRSACNFQHVK